MKKTVIVCITAVIIGILLTFTTVRAADGDTIFEGYSKSFVDIPHSNYLFGDFRNLYPGVSVSKNITVHNPDTRNVRIFLRARAVSSEYIYLLQHISLSVIDSDGSVISRSENPAQNMFLCELSGGESRELKIRLHINRNDVPDINSTFQKLDFIFSAEEFASQPDTFPKTDGDHTSLICTVSGIIMLASVAVAFLSRKYEQ